MLKVQKPNIFEIDKTLLRTWLQIGKTTVFESYIGPEFRHFFNDLKSITFLNEIELLFFLNRHPSFAELFFMLNLKVSFSNGTILKFSEFIKKFSKNKKYEDVFFSFVPKAKVTQEQFYILTNAFQVLSALCDKTCNKNLYNLDIYQNAFKKLNICKNDFSGKKQIRFLKKFFFRLRLKKFKQQFLALRYFVHRPW